MHVGLDDRATRAHVLRRGELEVAQQSLRLVGVHQPADATQQMLQHLEGHAQQHLPEQAPLLARRKVTLHHGQQLSRSATSGGGGGGGGGRQCKRTRRCQQAASARSQDERLGRRSNQNTLDVREKGIRYAAVQDILYC